MIARIGINGLGRVGRALLRILHDRHSRGDRTASGSTGGVRLEVAAINDQAPANVLARLVAHDSLHGRFRGEVRNEGDALLVDDQRISLFAHNQPGNIPWHDTGVELVVEATGRFRSRRQAAAHLSSDEVPDGVRRVVISATTPVEGPDRADATFCYGLNHQSFDPDRHAVISNASCTTNCLAPMLAVLDREFGVDQALMSTVHCYTNSQRLMDMAHEDPRRARAAAMNIIPTTSDAVGIIDQVLPRLAGKVDGLAYRVPVPDGSLVDVTARLASTATTTSIREAFRQAAETDLATILDVTEEELVSTDFIGSPASTTIDLPLTQVVGERLVRVVGWYDNEWGYANRLADLLEHVARVTLGKRSQASERSREQPNPTPSERAS